MQKILSRLIAVSVAMMSLTCAAAVDFRTVTNYAAACESELGFDASEVPMIDCSEGLMFNNVNDVVGHREVNANVDLVFACRHISADRSRKAASVELIIHNRGSGSTCFFEAKDFRTNTPAGADQSVDADLISPTSVDAGLSWKTFPILCVGCHVAGPYIASAEIAPFLARYGLLNDGHDTLATRYHSVGSGPNLGQPTVRNPFTDWDSIVSRNNVATENTCANQCHSIGYGSKAKPILSTSGLQLTPSLSQDIATVINSGLMPADNPSNTDVDNSYRWVNMSQHDWHGEFETLSELQYEYPRFYCPNPVALRAHAIDSDETFSTDELPDRLNRFNLQDGLVCLNNDQPNGKRCEDYQTRYMCGGRFTAFQNLDDPSYSGDWEPRSSFKGLCANPTWIQARYKSGGTWVYVNGPADRLAQFDTNGLVCYHSDQNNGQCSNYVVKFECAQ